MTRFSDTIFAQAKVFYVDQHRTLEWISDYFGGHPSKSAIAGWAKTRDRDGKNWDDYRYEKGEMLYRNIAPSERTKSIYLRLDEMMGKRMDDPGRFALALQRMTNAINEIVDPRMNLPVIVQTLEDLIAHVEYKHKTAPREYRMWFVDVIRTFKTELRDRLEGIPVASSEFGVPNREAGSNSEIGTRNPELPPATKKAPATTPKKRRVARKEVA
jgi:hypothetical protein